MGEEEIWKHSLCSDTRRQTRQGGEARRGVPQAESVEDVLAFHRLHHQSRRTAPRPRNATTCLPASCYSIFETMPPEHLGPRALGGVPGPGGGRRAYTSRTPPTCYWHLSAVDLELLSGAGPMNAFHYEAMLSVGSRGQAADAVRRGLQAGRRGVPFQGQGFPPCGSLSRFTSGCTIRSATASSPRTGPCADPGARAAGPASSRPTGPRCPEQAPHPADPLRPLGPGGGVVPVRPRPTPGDPAPWEWSGVGPQVQPQAQVIHVPHVQLDALADGNEIAPVDLGPPGEAGPDLVAPGLAGRVTAPGNAPGLWWDPPGSYFAEGGRERFGQFSPATGPQQPAEPGQALVPSGSRP